MHFVNLSLGEDARAARQHNPDSLSIQTTLGTMSSYRTSTIEWAYPFQNEKRLKHAAYSSWLEFEFALVVE